MYFPHKLVQTKHLKTSVNGFYSGVNFFNVKEAELLKVRINKLWRKPMTLLFTLSSHRNLHGIKITRFQLLTAVANKNFAAFTNDFT